jgi:hypothetical protein
LEQSSFLLAVVGCKGVDFLLLNVNLNFLLSKTLLSIAAQRL